MAEENIQDILETQVFEPVLDPTEEFSEEENILPAKWNGAKVLSIITAVCAALGFLVLNVGKIWGFEGISQQIDETLLTVVGASSILLGVRTGLKK